MALNILVIVGSVRKDRIGIRPAQYLHQLCASRGHQTTLVDPLDYRLPLLDRMYKEYPAGQAPETLERLAKLIQSSDAVLVVSGEYNHSIQPALSNLLDHFLEEWFWRPAAIACYSAGQFGGVRAVMQLRALLPEIGMPSIPSILALPRAQDLFDDQGQPRADWVAREALQATIGALLALQRADGGWSQTVPEWESDAFATGQTLYALALAGFTPERSEIRRGIDFLVATQNPDGSWPMLSRSTPMVRPAARSS